VGCEEAWSQVCEPYKKLQLKTVVLHGDCVVRSMFLSQLGSLLQRRKLVELGRAHLNELREA